MATQDRQSANRNDPGQPIAIVGIGCRFPGGVSSPDDLWQMLSGEGEANSEFPVDRGWNLDALSGPDPEAPGATYVRTGAPTEADDTRLVAADDVVFLNVGYEEDPPMAVPLTESNEPYPHFSQFLAEVARVLRAGGDFLYADLRPRECVAEWEAALEMQRGKYSFRMYSFSRIEASDPVRSNRE